MSTWILVSWLVGIVLLVRNLRRARWALKQADAHEHEDFPPRALFYWRRLQRDDPARPILRTYSLRYMAIALVFCIAVPLAAALAY